MGPWKGVLLVGLALIGISAVLLVAGFTVTDSNALLYVSMLASVVAVPVFLVGLIGFVVTRARSATVH